VISLRDLCVLCGEFLFGCPHARESWPMRRRDRRGRFQVHRPSYRVCLDCGHERDYTLLDGPQPATCNLQPVTCPEVR
jgi:hypothetical protein